MDAERLANAESPEALLDVLEDLLSRLPEPSGSPMVLIARDTRSTGKSPLAQILAVNSCAATDSVEWWASQAWSCPVLQPAALQHLGRLSVTWARCAASPLCL